MRVSTSLFFGTLLGLLAVGILILAGLSPVLAWLGGLAVAIAVFALQFSAYGSAAPQGVETSTGRAPRRTRALLLSAAISISLGALLGASVGQLGRGAVVGAMFIRPVDAVRNRVQARRS